MSSGAAGGTFDPQQALSQHVLKNFYVGGEWVKPQSDRTLELVSPLTEEIFLRLPEASEADIDRAVKAARQAFDYGPWPRMTMAERVKFVTARSTGTLAVVTSLAPRIARAAESNRGRADLQSLHRRRVGALVAE